MITKKIQAEFPGISALISALIRAWKAYLAYVKAIEGLNSVIRPEPTNEWEEMNNLLDINTRIATIEDETKEALVSMSAAMQFTEYLIQDRESYKAEERTPENVYKLEAELQDTLAWITTVLLNLSLLKKELEGQ